MKCYRLSICNNDNDIVVNDLEFQCSDPDSFSEWGEFHLLFDVDIVNLSLKSNGGETKGLMLLFL